MNSASLLRLLSLAATIALLPYAQAMATTAVTLSRAIDHPNSAVYVSGSGFAANEAIDVYFDTTDTFLVFSDNSGNFTRRALSVPGNALPGTHWITAVGRKNGDGSQKPFIVSTDWPQMGFTERGKRVNPYENILNTRSVKALDTAWTASFGYGIHSSPAIANGVVYIASDDGKLHAINATTGIEKWTAQTAGFFRDSPTIANGVVYIGSADHRVHAYNAASGQEKWAVWANAGVFASPIVANGVVYIGCDDGTFYALRASDGTLVWSANLGAQIESAPALANGILYVAVGNGTLRALDAATGASRWTANTVDGIWTSPAVAGGVVYVGSWDDNHIYAFNAATGALVWKADTYVEPLGPFAVTNNTVYVGTNYGNVYAYDATTGATKWVVYIGCVTASPAVVNGVLYAGTYGGKFYALDAATGATLWSGRGGEESSPAIANGFVYVGSPERMLMAYALDGGSNAAYHRSAAPPSYAALHPNLRLNPVP